MKLAFIDTETTGLDPDRHDIWELAIILRGPDHPDLEHCWQFRPDLRTADPTGLRVGRYYERNKVPPYEDAEVALLLAHPGISPDIKPTYIDRIKNVEPVALEVARLLDGATIIGAVPDFDARFLRRWLAQRGQALTANYHLIDVETLAAGALRKPPPWNFDEVLGAYGLSYDEADRHTALGDARMVRDLYDAVMGRPA